MPHPKKISAYSQTIIDIANALVQGKTVVLRNPIKRSLENMRFSFYGFRKAVEHEHAEGLFPNLNRINVRLFAEQGKRHANDHAEWVLVFEDIDKTPDALMVRNALAEIGVAPVEPPPQVVSMPPSMPPIAEPLNPLPEPESDIALGLYGGKEGGRHAIEKSDKLITDLFGIDPDKHKKK